jgi:hypothetical protein
MIAKTLGWYFRSKNSETDNIELYVHNQMKAPELPEEELAERNGEVNVSEQAAANDVLGRKVKTVTAYVTIYI